MYPCFPLLSFVMRCLGAFLYCPPPSIIQSSCSPGASGVFMLPTACSRLSPFCVPFWSWHSFNFSLVNNTFQLVYYYTFHRFQLSHSYFIFLSFPRSAFGLILIHYLICADLSISSSVLSFPCPILIISNFSLYSHLCISPLSLFISRSVPTH